MRDAIVQVVESYLLAVKSKDLSSAPFASDVTFESPLCPRLIGKESVVKFLSGLAPAVIDIRILQHIVEGEYCATLFEWDSLHGTVPVFARFHVQNGTLRAIRTFHDLRLLSELALKSDG